MGFIYIDSPTGNAFLAYELEGDGGNTISIRKYNSIVGLVGGGGYDEWQLSKENNVHVAASPDTWGENTYNSIVNVGTPSISVVDGGDVIIRHHYCPDGVHDYPSKGLVSLGGGGGGVVSNWFFFFFFFFIMMIIIIILFCFILFFYYFIFLFFYFFIFLLFYFFIFLFFYFLIFLFFYFFIFLFFYFFIFLFFYFFVFFFFHFFSPFF